MPIQRDKGFGCGDRSLEGDLEFFSTSDPIRFRNGVRRMINHVGRAIPSRDPDHGH